MSEREREGGREGENESVGKGGKDGENKRVDE